MKTLLLSAAFALAACTAVAQTASIKAAYDQTSFKRNSATETGTRKMILLAGTAGSKYYNEISEYCDSMTSTPAGKKQLAEIQMAAWVSYGADGSMSIDMTKGNAPHKTVHTYITKDFSAGTMRVYDRWGEDDGFYDEPLAGLDYSRRLCQNHTRLRMPDGHCRLSRTSLDSVVHSRDSVTGRSLETTRTPGTYSHG